MQKKPSKLPGFSQISFNLFEISYLTLSRYFSSVGLTRIFSPTVINGGTYIVTPFSSVAGLFEFEAVAPRTDTGNGRVIVNAASLPRRFMTLLPSLSLACSTRAPRPAMARQSRQRMALSNPVTVAPCRSAVPMRETCPRQTPIAPTSRNKAIPSMA